jgi:hypothetical protein
MGHHIQKETQQKAPPKATTWGTWDPKKDCQTWVANEHLVTHGSCEQFGLNDYIFEKYGMAMGLDGWWEECEE